MTNSLLRGENPLGELFFHGRITREDAEELLRHGRDGVFLLRCREIVNADVDIFILSIVFKSQVVHYSIDRRPDGTYNIPGGRQFIGPVEIVHYHMTTQDGIKTLLTEPLNRPPDLGAVVYWGLTSDIVEKEFVKVLGLSSDAAREEVLFIFSNSSNLRPKSFRELLSRLQFTREWYRGDLTREATEKLLESSLSNSSVKTGTFLLRRKKPDAFVLSVVHNGDFKHYLIRERSSQNDVDQTPSSSCGFGMDGGPVFPNLIELVHWYHAYSDGLPCTLAQPCPSTVLEPLKPSLTKSSSQPAISQSASTLSTLIDNNLPLRKDETNLVTISNSSGNQVLIRSMVSSSAAEEALSKRLDAIAVGINLPTPESRGINSVASTMNGMGFATAEAPASFSETEGTADQSAAVSSTKIVINVHKSNGMPRPNVSSTSSKITTFSDAKNLSVNRGVQRLQSGVLPASKLAPRRVIRLPQALRRGLDTSNTAVLRGNGKSTLIFDKVISPTASNGVSNHGAIEISKRTSPIFNGGSQDDWDEPTNGSGDMLPHDGCNDGSDLKRPAPHSSPRISSIFSALQSKPPMEIIPDTVKSHNQHSTNGHIIQLQHRQEPLLLQDSVTRLDPDWLEIHQTIGHGHFGTVLFGYLVTPQRRIPVAIKSVRETESHCLDSLVREATIMSNLTHPNIITFYGLCYIETMLLVMEYAPLGTLQKFIRANRDFPLIRIVKLLTQVADAMRYLEKNKLVHRDLACRNVLLISETQAKVSDFGMSRALVVEREYYKSQNVGKWPLKWYPPESIYYWKFDSKTDVWSYGVTMWESTSYGLRPYQGMDGWQVLKYIESGKRLERPAACPPALYCLMMECWKFKPSDRPSFEEILVTMLDIECQLMAAGDVTEINSPHRNQQQQQKQRHG